VTGCPALTSANASSEEKLQEGEELILMKDYEGTKKHHKR